MAEEFEILLAKIKLRRALITLIIISLPLSLYIYIRTNEKNMNKNEIYVAQTSMPFSADPIDFDYFEHHSTMPSVLATLVSTSVNGKIIGLIAKSWESSNQFKTWKLKIKKNLLFSNGDPITADAVSLSLKRIIFIKKSTKSMSGLFEFLVEFKKINKLMFNIDGIKVVDDEIILNFTKPIPNFLQKISFGLYAITNANDFNKTTGKWKNKNKVISSNKYIISRWSDDQFEISKRNDSQTNPNEIQTIHFISSYKIKKSSDLKEVQIVIGDARSLIVDTNYNFIAPTQNINIGYIHCYGWNKPGPLSKVLVRKYLREQMYKSFEMQNFEYTTEFFPESIADVSSNKKMTMKKPKFNSFKITTLDLPAGMKINENKSKKSTAEYFKQMLIDLAKSAQLKLSFVDFSNENSEKQTIGIVGTGVMVEDPIEDIRFMFLSKHGIKLPDSTGKIKAELKNENPDISKINQELWKQAIIWPIRHYTAGYWIRKNSSLNISNINLTKANIDFQFMTWY